MRSKDPDIMKRIVDFVEAYHLDYNSSPSLRVIADGVGIGSTTVYRYLMETVSYTHLDVYKRQSLYWNNIITKGEEV